MSKRFHIRTFGCQMNEDDSERLASMLNAAGFRETGDVDEADVVVLNTCCIRENADNKLYGTLGHLKSLKDRNPSLRILVGGCLAQKDQELVREKARHVDVVFGTHNVHRAVDLLRQTEADGPIVEVLDAAAREDAEQFPSALTARREIGYGAWVTIQIGCDNSCAFCIVPAVRGPEMSRPFAQLVRDVERLAASGVSEITLLGQNVNSYGRDLTIAERKALGDGAASISGEPEGNQASPSRQARGSAQPIEAELVATERCGAAWLTDRRTRPLFADLLRAVGAVDGIRRVRFTSPHPKDLRQETVAAMRDVESVVEHLHLPLQSGSDRVLAAMHRGYTAARYAEKVAAARSAIDDLAVSTDLIVGFPGETEREFEETLSIAAELAFDSAFTFVYSARPGTEAAELPDPVPHETAVDRMQRLRAIVERSSLRANERRVGRIEEVLVEGPSKRDSELLTGRTRQNRLVHFNAPMSIPAGAYATVEVTGAAMSHLRGHLLEITARPRHRRRLEVAAL